MDIITNPYEIDITDFYYNAGMRDYSASAAELGENAGEITWQHAVEGYEEYTLINAENRDNVIAFIKSSGFDFDHIYTDQELNALLLQWISGDIRETCLEDDRDAWEQFEAEEACTSGHIFRSDGKVYYALY